MVLPRLLHSASKAITFRDFGAPHKVLNVTSEPLPDLAPMSVQVKILAAPMNPADINQIQGTYPSKPSWKDSEGYSAGNEGVAQVEAIGESVKTLSVGDWVIPASSGRFSTWRSHTHCSLSDVLKIDNRGISALQAATISVNPCTAYRMLKDFVKLEEGDVVIQNGANSGVGHAVIQLCKAWGIRTVNIIRNRPNVDSLVSSLEALGATHVILDEDLRKPATSKLLESLGSPPRLALNCVGGKNATNMARLLGKYGSMVTYGGMSKEPITIPTSLFIFNFLSCKGFWMTKWNQENSMHDRTLMLEELLDMMRKKKFEDPICDVIKLRVDDSDEVWETTVREASQRTVEGFTKKQVLVFES